MSPADRSPRYFSPDDAGKRVVTPDGDVVGDVELVRGGTAYVRPSPGLLDGYGSVLRSPWERDEPFRLDSQWVDSVTDDEVLLRTPVADNRLTPGTR